MSPRGGVSTLDDPVATDAKRILLRYGAPISVLEKIEVKDRIKYARAVTKTALPQREPTLKGLLQEGGYLDA